MHTQLQAAEEFGVSRVLKAGRGRKINRGQERKED